MCAPFLLLIKVQVPSEPNEIEHTNINRLMFWSRTVSLLAVEEYYTTRYLKFAR